MASPQSPPPQGFSGIPEGDQVCTAFSLDFCFYCSVFFRNYVSLGFIWKKKIVQLHGGGGGGVDFLGIWVSGRWVSDKSRDTHEPIPG